MRIKMKNILQWIFALIVSAIIFVVAIVTIPIQQKSIETVELTYIFVDEYWNEYDIFEKKHGSADDWSFLFEENIDTWDNNKWYLPNKDYIDWDWKDDKLNNNWENKLDINIALNNKILAEKQVELLLENSLNLENTGSWDIENIAMNCVTPWNTVVKHWESILAYQQRKDVPTICNVQRRKCNDGYLNWKYIQAACVEDIEYEYTKVQAISYNNEMPGDLIQNPNNAKNDDAIFNNQWKINQKNTTKTTSWDNTKNDPIIDQKNTDLTNKEYANCFTPWWAVVSHGQFIKTYSSPLWFIDQKCKVELRLCLNGKFNGNYSYKSCEYKDMTFQDYLAGNDDITKPTPDLMIDALLEESEDSKSKGIIKWFDWMFD